MPSSHQLLLLADHIKLSLLELARAPPSSKLHAQIARSLSSLQEGLATLPTDDPDFDTLTSQYATLSSQYAQNRADSEVLKSPNDPSLASDFAHASIRPGAVRTGSKSVRFSDRDEEDEANRAALFPTQYTDEPVPDPTEHLDNQQLHSYHTSVLREQDEQLDTLSVSIGRTRELSIQIGDELDSHVALLDDIESGVDRQEGGLQRAQRRLRTVGRDARENWSCLTIVGLIIILVVLIIVLKG